MKRKLRALYILIATAILLAAGTAMLSIPHRIESAEETASADVPCTITEFSVNTVSALAITNPKNSIGLLLRAENVELVLADDDGQLISSNVNVSQSELRSIVYMLCHIQGIKELPMPEDKASYGFDAPCANLTFIFSDGTQREFLMGSKIPGNRGYYLFDISNNTLFIIGMDTAALLLRSEQDFVSHFVFPTVPTSEYQSVSRIEFKRNGEKFVIENVAGDFRFTSPVDQRIRAYNVYSSIIAPLGGIYADSCISLGTDISEYGFDDAQLDVSMCVGDKTYRALFLTSGETLLMADAFTGNIYTVDSDVLKLLPESYMSLLDGKPYYYSLGDCREVRIVSDNSELIFEISGSGKNISASYDGKKLDAEAVSALSQSLNDVEIAQRAEKNATGDTLLTLYFTLNDGRTEIVKILCSGDTCFCEVNGIVNFTVSSVSVENLISALGEYGF